MSPRPRSALFALLVLGACGLPLLAAPPAAAAPPAPFILNTGAQNGGNAQWLESQGLPDQGGVRQVWVTFLVQHPVGRSITGIRADLDFDNNDDTSSAGVTSVPAQELRTGATNRLETSRVTVPFAVSSPGEFTCPVFGSATRSRDAAVRFRVVDSTGESSGSVSGTVRFVEDNNCFARQDFPRLTSTSQNATDVVPGQNITYTFSCDDADGAGSDDDDCDRANIRWRRLDDGTTSGTTLKTGINDSTTTSHTMSFPSQGLYVVEAQLGNENGSFPNTGGTPQGWVRLGNAVVNDSASSLSGAIVFPGANPSSPPSVNAGTPMSAVATAADAGGAIQVIEWDSDNNGAFERTEFTVPIVSSGNIVHPALTAGELTQGVATATPGLRTVQARVTDNGALDASDNIRRSLTFAGQLRVNAIPTAAPVTRTTNEDTAVTVDLLGNDSDSQPNALAYDIVSAPPASTGSLGPVSSSGAVTFTPAPNYNGTTSFSYRVRDGSSSTVAAWASSNTATVTIAVNPVNDAPTVTGGSITTNEDTPGSLTVTGSDVEDGPNLAFTADTQPMNGSATCTATGTCTFTPAPDFFGTDSFIMRGTDSGGLSATATVTVTVNAVNDAPVAVDDTVTVAEDSTGNSITLAAGDVDDVSLSFVAPVDDADHGTVACSGHACTYTPNPDYNGPDSFTFEVSDGELTDTGTITIDVTPVNDAPVAVDVWAETDEDVPALLTLGGTDVDGDAVTLVSASDPAHGTATATGPGSVQYLGDADFSGIDVFDFTITDGNGAQDDGTVTITVLPVNDAPVIEDQTMNVDEDVPAVLSLAAGDVDGDALSWSIVSGPTSGHLVGDGPDLTYTGDPHFHGTDSFTVQVDDGNGGVDTAVITVVVNPVNDAPAALDVSATTDEEVPVTLALLASDADGDALTYALASTPSHGTASVSGSNVTYTPATDFEGVDTFRFRVTDPSGASSEATGSITVVGRPLIGTHLVAKAAVARVDLRTGVVVFPELEATLLTATDEPMAGRTLSFRAGGTLLCSAVTDADGVGRCGATAQGIAALLHLGYQVRFAGDADHAGSTARGPIIQVLSVML